MHSAPLLTGWDTAVFILPFIGLLGLWMFGLDELLATPSANSGRRAFCQVGTGKNARMTDPDGTLWPRSLAADCGMLPPAMPSAPAAGSHGSSASHSKQEAYTGTCCRFLTPAESREMSRKNC